jgi:universal stress protein A
VLEIRHILAPTDLSQHAEVALRYACGLAERFQATLHLLHVLPDVMPITPDPDFEPSLPIPLNGEAETESLQALRRALHPSWGQPAQVETDLLHGDPIAGILDYASHHPIDLIVIATHGRTGLSHALLGSIAEQIVREAPCPVLTIRDRRGTNTPATS